MTVRRRLPKHINDGLNLIALAILLAAAIIAGAAR